MVKIGRPSPGLDDYLYWQERLANREASGLSIDEFCADEDVSRSTFYSGIRTAFASGTSGLKSAYFNCPWLPKVSRASNSIVPNSTACWAGWT